MPIVIARAIMNTDYSSVFSYKYVGCQTHAILSRIRSTAPAGCRACRAQRQRVARDCKSHSRHSIRSNEIQRMPNKSSFLPSLLRFFLSLRSSPLHFSPLLFCSRETEQRRRPHASLSAVAAASPSPRLSVCFLCICGHCVRPPVLLCSVLSARAPSLFSAKRELLSLSASPLLLQTYSSFASPPLLDSSFPSPSPSHSPPLAHCRNSPHTVETRRTARVRVVSLVCDSGERSTARRGATRGAYDPADESRVARRSRADHPNELRAADASSQCSVDTVHAA